MAGRYFCGKQLGKLVFASILSDSVLLKYQLSNGKVSDF